MQLLILLLVHLSHIRFWDLLFINQEFSQVLRKVYAGVSSPCVLSQSLNHIKTLFM